MCAYLDKKKLFLCILSTMSNTPLSIYNKVIFSRLEIGVRYSTKNKNQYLIEKIEWAGKGRRVFMFNNIIIIVLFIINKILWMIITGMYVCISDISFNISYVGNFQNAINH